MQGLPYFRSFLALFGLLVVCLPIQAQPGNEPLLVGLTGKYPPFNTIDEQGKLTGFDVDMAEAICRRLERPCEFRILQWDGILSALLAGRIHVIIGSMAVTEERSQRVLFSIPYYESGAQLFATANAPPVDSSEFRLGVTLGTTYGTFAKSKFPNATLRTYKGDIEILQDIRNGRLDGMVTDRLVGLHMNQALDAGLVLAGEPLFLEKMAIPVHPNQPELKEALDQALVSIRAGPEYERIFSKYFGAAGSPVDAGFSWAQATALMVAALWATIQVSFSGIALGLLLSGFLALGMLGLPRPLSLGVVGVVDFVRSTPFLVQLFVLYFGFPALGLSLSPWVAAVLAIALHSSAYLAEILKTAYLSVPLGQRQAARVLGLSPKESLRHVVWPQMVPVIVAPFLNTIVAMIKDSAIVSVISVHELTMQAQQLISSTFRPMEFYLMAALLYALVTYPLLLLGRRMERHFIRKGLLSG